MSKIFGKTTLCAVLGASLLAGSAMPVRADRDDHCRKELQKAEQNLRKATQKHGEHSRQAEQQRRHLREVRERCHGRWGDHDREHDRDHDRR
jgi:hypothetical protein